jgi:hypothetical protein
MARESRDKHDSSLFHISIPHRLAIPAGRCVSRGLWLVAMSLDRLESQQRNPTIAPPCASTRGCSTISFIEKSRVSRLMSWHLEMYLTTAVDCQSSCARASDMIPVSPMSPMSPMSPISPSSHPPVSPSNYVPASDALIVSNPQLF